MKIWIGKSLIVIGGVHSITGFVVFSDVVGSITEKGLFNSVPLNGPYDRQAAFWFIVTGLALVIIGSLVDWIERKDMGIPGFLSWSLLAVAALGAFIMPLSGFWLLLIPAAGLFCRGRLRTR